MPWPGTSEHQLGLAADIVALDYQALDSGYAKTPEAKWLAEHAHEYGFILRYDLSQVAEDSCSQLVITSKSVFKDRSK